MEPSGRDEAPVEELLDKEWERWERVADAKTPEELERALREPKRPAPAATPEEPPGQDSHLAQRDLPVRRDPRPRLARRGDAYGRRRPGYPGA
jgi:hypothetical protein